MRAEVNAIITRSRDEWESRDRGQFLGLVLRNIHHDASIVEQPRFLYT